MSSILCTFEQCIPAYVIGFISLVWNAYHEWLIYKSKSELSSRSELPLQRNALRGGNKPTFP